jgi:hypothetical protein
MLLRAIVGVGIVLGLNVTGCSPNLHRTITQDELVRRTQELLDAVPGGDRRPFQKYLADDCMIFDEKGRSMDKKALLEDLSPMPPGYSGNIKVVKPQSRILGDTVILGYDLDETETIFGQNLKARYHTTDTWVRRNGNWQIVAEQVLRYYEDPAPGKPDLLRYRDYVGEYELTPGTTLTVSIRGVELFSQRGIRQEEALVPEAPDIFFRHGVEGRRLFRRNNNGKVDAMVDRRNNEDIIWTKMK